MILGALVTFRRPDELATFLDAMARQSRRLDRLVVVDNDPEGSGWPPVEAHLSRADAGLMPSAAERIDYLRQDENRGAAGGWAVGQTFLAQNGSGHDWIVMLDDDDPPTQDGILKEREAFATRIVEQDPRTAAVGGVGAFFDRTRGRLRRLRDDELRGPVAVDYLGSNHFPMYRIGVMRQLGPFFPGLFLGYTELEYSLRVREAGFTIYVDGDAALQRRTDANRLGMPSRARSRLRTGMPPWRVYYTTRNLIWMLRTTGYPQGAVRVSVRRGLGRGLSQLLVSPRAARRHFQAGWYGVLHGWTNTMGPVLDPDDEALRVRRDKIMVRHGPTVEPIPPPSSEASEQTSAPGSMWRETPSLSPHRVDSAARAR